MQCKTLDEYITKYGINLQENAQNALAPMHIPGVNPLPDVVLNRTLLEAQAHAVAGSVAALKKRNGTFIGAECGTGKTIMALATMHQMKKNYNALVFCPGHTCDKWEREIRDTVPAARIAHITSWKDLLSIRHMRYQGGPVWYIISRDTAKLGAEWDHALVDRGEDSEGGRLHCPTCGKRQVGKTCYLTRKELGKLKRKCACGEMLWTWKNTTRVRNRWFPAKYIHRYMRRFFDFLIVDEAHEEKDGKSKQGEAIGSLIASVDKTLLLTGTLIGGYAEHIRTLLWKISPQTMVADGFKFSDKTKFSVQYGRIETKTSTTKGRKKKAVTSTIRTVRPGIMPTLFGKHLLGCSVFLSLDEVSNALPKLTEDVMTVDLDPDVFDEYKRIECALNEEMKVMAARRDIRLCGTMINATMNWIDYPFGWGDLGYYDSDGDYNRVVTPRSFDTNRIYPKEQALIDLCQRERNEGRKTWVFVENTTKRDVVARLQAWLNKAGLRTTSLRQKVSVKKREKWIRDHGPGHDVVLSHPKLIETGLDLFDKELETYNFSSLAFYEVGFNLFTLRQASRRHWRIAQPEECRTWFMNYAGTMQERTVELMARKMAASAALEGKFSAEGLAALAGDEVSIELELARSLDKRLDPGAGQRAWSTLATI